MLFKTALARNALSFARDVHSVVACLREFSDEADLQSALDDAVFQLCLHKDDLDQVGDPFFSATELLTQFNPLFDAVAKLERIDARTDGFRFPDFVKDRWRVVLNQEHEVTLAGMTTFVSYTQATTVSPLTICASSAHELAFDVAQRTLHSLQDHLHGQRFFDAYQSLRKVPLFTRMGAVPALWRARHMIVTLDECQADRLQVALDREGAMIRERFAPSPEASAGSSETPSDGTVDERMMRLLILDGKPDHDKIAWSQRAWAEQLKCTPAAVAKTDAWKTIQTLRKGAYSERLLPPKS